jgi:hypothetical protein
MRETWSDYLALVGFALLLSAVAFDGSVWKILGWIGAVLLGASSLESIWRRAKSGELARQAERRRLYDLRVLSGEIDDSVQFPLNVHWSSGRSATFLDEKNLVENLKTFDSHQAPPRSVTDAKGHAVRLKVACGSVQELRYESAQPFVAADAPQAARR